MIAQCRRALAWPILANSAHQLPNPNLPINNPAKQKPKKVRFTIFYGVRLLSRQFAFVCYETYQCLSYSAFNCNFEGKKWLNPKFLEEFVRVGLFPVCPEVLGGLSVPRVPAEVWVAMGWMCWRVGRGL